MKIAVAGTGYVGLVTAVCLSEIGHDVTCVDMDAEKVRVLQSGKSPIFEADVEMLMLKNKERLHYTADYAAAYGEADVLYICVGTPERRDGRANLSYLYAVAGQIAESLVKSALVVVKSTVPIGTCAKVETFMNKRTRDGVSVEVASNPEFLSQGTAVHDTFNADRIVVGTSTRSAAALLTDLYAGFGQRILHTTRESSEMIKYASNDFLALKISYINEIANLCELVGADVEDVASGMGLDKRIGNRFLKAGIGYGGSCFPKDTKALHWLAKYHDYELKTIKAAIEVNENQKMRLLKKARKYYKSFEGLTVAVLGLTFKPETDDLRDAPSLENIPILLEDGAQVRAWDPAGCENFKKQFPQLHYCEDIEETLAGADLCLIFTEWRQLRNFGIEKYKELMKHPIVLDGRNCYAPESAKQAGVQYECIGRPIL